MTHDTRTRGQRRVSRLLSIVSLAGLVLAAWAIFMMVVDGGQADGGTFRPPGEVRVRLEAGEHRLWVQSRSPGSSSDSCNDEAADELARRADMTVRLDGRRIAVRRAACAKSQPFGGAPSFSARSFVAPRTATYVIAGDDVTPGDDTSGELHVDEGEAGLPLTLFVVAGGILAFGAFFLKLARY